MTGIESPGASTVSTSGTDVRAPCGAGETHRRRGMSAIGESVAWPCSAG
jgi:hypothetical protein